MTPEQIQKVAEIFDEQDRNNLCPEPARPERGEFDVQRLVLELRAENKRLSESQRFLRRIVASLVDQAGGEMRVDDVTMAKIPLDPEILTWSEPAARKLMIRVRETKLQNDEDQAQGGPKTK